MITVTVPFRRSGHFFPAIALRESGVDSTCLQPRINTQVRATDRDTVLGERRGC